MIGWFTIIIHPNYSNAMEPLNNATTPSTPPAESAAPPPTSAPDFSPAATPAGTGTGTAGNFVGELIPPLYARWFHLGMIVAVVGGVVALVAAVMRVFVWPHVLGLHHPMTEGLTVAGVVLTGLGGLSALTLPRGLGLWHLGTFSGWVLAVYLATAVLGFEAASTLAGIVGVVVFVIVFRAARPFKSPATRGFCWLAIFALPAVGVGIAILISLNAQNLLPRNFDAFPLLLQALFGALPVISLGPVVAMAVASRRPLSDAVQVGVMPTLPTKQVGKWVAVGAGLAALGCVVGGWIWLAPVPYDAQRFEDFRAEIECKTPREQNGYWDYVAMSDVLAAADKSATDQFSWYAERALEHLRDPETAASVDLQPAQAECLRLSKAMELWDQAMQRPVSRGDVNFDLAISDSVPIVEISTVARPRLLATLDDPDAFVATVGAVRHAIVTLFDRGSLVDAAIGTVMAEILTDYAGVFLARMRNRITPTHRDTLAREFATVAAAVPSGRHALVTEFATLPQQFEIERQRGSFGQRLTFEILGSRNFRIYEFHLDYMSERTALTNHDWRVRHADATASGDEHVRALFASLSPWERIRLGWAGIVMATVSIPIYTGIEAEIRTAETRMRMLQVALRIEAELAHQRPLPTSTEFAGEISRDDWDTNRHYYLRPISTTDGRLGYELGSVGPDASVSGTPQTAASTSSGFRITIPALSPGP